MILAALLSLSGVQPAVADASDWLPLAVGNSWTYTHNYFDSSLEDGGIVRHSAYWDQWPALDEPFLYPEFTITVEQTKVIDGKTYYVISDMPAYWPPAPPHFIAGKKLRWKGTRLMERTADGEQALFRFDGTTADYIRTDSRLEVSNLYKTRYLIPTTEGDNRVVVIASLKPVPWYGFEFHGNDVGPRWCDFFAGYGPTCRTGRFNVFVNQLIPVRAVIGGTPVEFADALIPTGISSSSWGQIKQSWLAGERSTP